MRLTKSDIQYLLSIGYVEKDIAQIKQALQHTTYEMNTRLISQKKVIELLPRKKVLSGIARCAFHGIAVRTIPSTENYIVFYNE